ncbi:MAG: sodium:proton antiporter [Crocinitomicaceae bacterium]|jgi:Kef-type K+ transport system membrane component KefB|nr:sodium:proton antiporter [Crocinitomicaceae bacterium]
MDDFFSHISNAFHLPLKNPVLIFSLILFIILLSPILLRRLRIPAIIGLIISGVVIGPKGFNLIGEKLMESDGAMKLFATIGLLYIMFMAGLELDMNEFRKYRNKSFTFGFLTFIVPITLGFPICYYGLKLDFTASLLTASMFATHTLVAYPIVSKYGITKRPAVAISIGGTILTDTAVLIILAVISSSANGNLDLDFWVRLISSLTIFSIIMFIFIPRIARWFFGKLESEKTSHYIFVLSIICFAAFLAEMAGVEHIIGAFVAGLVLNKLIPHSSALMNRIEFIGNAIFIPFFLISVGMVVDVKVLFHGYWALIIAGVLTTFAIFSKWLAALLMQLIFRMTSSERQIIFGLSTAHAAATLAIIMVGFQKEILSIEIVNGTIILILITCMVASFVTENAGRKLLIETRDDELLHAPQKRSQHLLVATNELRGNENLLDLSMLITDKTVTNPISVVSVLANDQEAEKRIRASRNHMEEITRHYSSGEIVVNAIATIDHNLSSGIARTSKELAADIVILNDSHKMNLLLRIVGDDRDHLLDVCPKTVFFCQLDRSFAEKKRIILICPPFADLENSFASWLERILRLTKELRLELVIFAQEPTFEKIRLYFDYRKTSADMEHKNIVELDDFFLQNFKIERTDLLIMCSSRPGSVSWSINIDHFLPKIEKAFEQNDKIVIYPSQEVTENVFSTYDDISAEAISKGVETIQKIGKEVGSIFKK